MFNEWRMDDRNASYVTFGSKSDTRCPHIACMPYFEKRLAEIGRTTPRASITCGLCNGEVLFTESYGKREYCAAFGRNFRENHTRCRAEYQYRLDNGECVYCENDLRPLTNGICSECRGAEHTPFVGYGLGLGGPQMR